VAQRRLDLRLGEDYAQTEAESPQAIVLMLGM
jgi:hypothetical protein